MVAHSRAMYSQPAKPNYTVLYGNAVSPARANMNPLTPYARLAPVTERKPSLRKYRMEPLRQVTKVAKTAIFPQTVDLAPITK